MAKRWWHHYRYSSLFLCCFRLCVDVLWLCQYNQDKSWQCVYFFGSSVGLSMPFGWSACARHTGIRSPSRGHRQTVCWATVAQNVGNECPNIGLVFGQYSWFFAMFKQIFLVLRAIFNDTSMVFNDTSMILLSAFSKKSHWL